MRILLLNDNPVVTKLVTLSAQKSGNEILVANSIDIVDEGVYELLIVDEGVYSQENMQWLQINISYQYSLYMLSRGAQSISSFDLEMKKPFLPTDLVELMSSISLKISNMTEKEFVVQQIDIANNIDLDDLTFDDNDTKQDTYGLNQNFILDKDEVEEVKNLLEETEAEEEFVNDDMDFENLLKLLDNEKIKDSLEFEDMYERLDLDELDDKIKNAVADLTEDEFDLELDIPIDDLIELSSLDENAFNSVLNEEVQKGFSDSFIEEEFDQQSSDKDIEKLQRMVDCENKTTRYEGNVLEIENQNESVQALQTLLKALADKDVAASLQGLNVNINISFGNNNDK
jgi:uncharacterized membrane protein